MVSHKVADAFAGYHGGAFGYDAIDMNAFYTTNDPEWVYSGSVYTPSITSRNVEQWRMVETDADYTYDASKMYFPLPRHHLYVNLVEIEFEFEGLFGDPASGDNVPIVAKIEICKKEDGEWVATSTRTFSFSLIAIEGGTIYYRHAHFFKTFINWDSGYDVQQYMIRPVISYDGGGRFRIEKAYGRVYLHRNSITD